MLKVLELFAGIGACSKALTNLGVEHEIVDAVEIDKFAVKSFNAVHGTNFEPQDIRKWDKQHYCENCKQAFNQSELDVYDLCDGVDFVHKACQYICDDLAGNVDLIMHGSPCQDFSLAGRGAGGDEGSGTRSSLMYETLRIVEKLRPKYVLWENVPNILSERHLHNFNNYTMRMRELGYVSQYAKLNAKDFEVPQNRLRVFTVSVYLPEQAQKFGEDLRSLGIFRFPEPAMSSKALKDVLEPEVDEKYYLSDEKTTQFRVIKGGSNIAGNLNYYHYDQMNRVYSSDSQSPALDTMAGGNREPKIAIKTATKKGYDEAMSGDSVNLAYPESKTRRGRVGHSVAQTLTTSDNMGVIDSSLRIRKLTPKECWRLMGFTDEDFEKAKGTGCSNSQLYKQAGNSIVVNVLEAILNNLLEEKNV